MRDQCICDSVQSILKEFKSCFTRPTFQSFCHLICGWIVCRERRWITRVFQALGDPSKKHLASYYRFFSKAAWRPDRLGKVLLELLLPYLPSTVEAMVDDTLCRRSGPRIFGIAMHHDGVASTYGWATNWAFPKLACGHSWVVLAVRLPLPWKKSGLAVPVLFRLYRAKSRCPIDRYKKRTEFARDMICLLRSWLPKDRRLLFTGDREYASKSVLRDLDEDIVFVGPMPMNAALYEPVELYSGTGRPRVHGDQLPNPREHVKENSRRWVSRTVRIYGKKVKLKTQDWTCLWYRATGRRLIRVVVTRDPKGNLQDRVLFSTDPSASAVKIIEQYAGRWLVECNFRDMKQLMGLNDPQNGWSRGRAKKTTPGPKARGVRGKRAVDRTAPFIWYSYGIVVVWYLRENRWKDDFAALRRASPWYTHKRSPSFADMLNAARNELLAHRLSANVPWIGTIAKSRKVLRMMGMAA